MFKKRDDKVMVECYRCGRNITEEVIFCPYCGAKQRSSIEVIEKNFLKTEEPANVRATQSIKKDVSKEAKNKTPEADKKGLDLKQVVLWVILIIVGVSFFALAIKYWNEFSKMLP
ncbi:MAG: zinc ribbon domain-containing protein [Candidatus Woesearchaeota archaeon]